MIPRTILIFIKTIKTSNQNTTYQYFTLIIYSYSKIKTSSFELVFIFLLDTNRIYVVID